MMNMNRVKPVVVVLGATGTGKSKLGLKIASKFRGEIISADSMQVYKGMDIVTNKVHAEQQMMVPHHMLDFLDPSQLYSVLDFRNSALAIIRRVHDEGKLPVIVGGTHFYVESILWNILVWSESEKCSGSLADNSCEVLQNILSALKNRCVCSDLSITSDVQNQSKNENIEKEDEANIILKSDAVGKSDYCLKHSCDSGSDKSSDITHGTGKEKFLSGMIDIPNEDLQKILEKVDPQTASILHPNDRRKMISSLHFWAKTGTPQSEHLRRQRDEAGGVSLGGTIRFPHTAIFWITCDQKVLDDRLDARVDAMIDQGLLREISDFHVSHNAPALRKLEEESGEQLGADPFKRGTPLHSHYTKGILQCIGFKEFHPYLMLDEEKRNSEEGRNLYAEGIKKMKLKTKQYSRTQIRWIKNRFFVRDRQKIPVYTVDGTNPENWDQEVTKITDEVVQSILKGRTPQTPPSVLDRINEDLVKPDNTRRFCETCNKVLLGKHQWEHHLNGVGHRLTIKRKRKREETVAVAEERLLLPAQEQTQKIPGQVSKMAKWINALNKKK